MDSFTTPVRTSDFVLDPSTILMWRRRYVSDSSEEEEGVTEGSPLAQPLMDTLEPKPDTLVRHPEEPDGLSLSTPSEPDRRSEESPVDKANGKDSAQLDDAFLDALKNLRISNPVGVNRSNISCFCSCPFHRF